LAYDWMVPERRHSRRIQSWDLKVFTLAGSAAPSASRAQDRNRIRKGDA
jgi:hypothetical protein